VIHDAKDQQGNLVPFSPATSCAASSTFTRPAGSAGRRARDGILPDRPQHRPEQPVIPPMGRSGRARRASRPIPVGRRRIRQGHRRHLRLRRSAGLEIDGILQEGGAGQIELNLAHGDPVRWPTRSSSSSA
jgi:glutamine synthetase